MRISLSKSLNQDLGPTCVVLVKQRDKKELTCTAGSSLQKAVLHCCLYAICLSESLLCPITPFLSISRVLFELPATGHSPMPLCWVLFHGIHIALSKRESLCKQQQILSHTFSCLSFLITFSGYILQDVWDLSTPICCSFSLVLQL